MHISLGSWAVVNFGSSLALMNNPDPPFNKYFYHMNIYWNVVNATIAGFGLAGISKKDFSGYDLTVLQKEQRKIERLMLMNIFLDVFYIGSGVILDQYSYRFKKNPDRIDGYGKSMIVQGAFLFLFDNIYYQLYRKNGKLLQEMKVSMSASPYGLGFQVKF